MLRKHKQADEPLPRRSKRIKGEAAEGPLAGLRRSKRIKVEATEKSAPPQIRSRPKTSRARRRRYSPPPQKEVDLPPLLALPAELRNAIYEYALEEPTPIQVNTETREPGLLSTNRQIHGEARKLHYSINTFNIPIRDCDATLLGKFYRMIRDSGLYQAGDPSVPFLLQSQLQFVASRPALPQWPNVLKWCSDAHNGRCCVVGELDPKLAAPLNIVTHAAMQMAVRCPQGEWELCRKALELWRPVAGLSDRSWLDD